MFYLFNITERQPFWVPRRYSGEASIPEHLELTGTVTQEHLSLPVRVEDLRPYGLMLSVELPEGGMYGGEYRYILRNTDGGTISDGVAVIGDYRIEQHEHDEQISYNEYEQQ